MLALIVAIIAFIRAVAYSLRDPKFKGLLTFVTVLILMSAVFYHRVEGWSFLDAIYFCVVTLATVGYGDFVPKTTEGRIYTIFFIIFGIGIFLAFVNTIITDLRQRRVEKTESKKEKTESKKKSA